MSASVMVMKDAGVAGASAVLALREQGGISNLTLLPNQPFPPSELSDRP